jgi:hypothetical protein
MYMSQTTKHQQPILLEHAKAKMLEKLAERTGQPKQVLLREAVDYLLALNGARCASQQIDIVRQSLVVCELRMNEACSGKYTSVEDMFGACMEVLVRVSKVLDELGESSRDGLFPKVRNSGEHWTTRLRKKAGGGKNTADA